MTASTDIGSLITRSLGIHAGRPILSGTGVTVRRIAIYHKMGLGPQEIADRIGLSLAQIYAALSYYHLNQAEVEADLADEEAETARIEKLLEPEPL